LRGLRTPEAQTTQPFSKQITREAQKYHQLSIQTFLFINFLRKSHSQLNDLTSMKNMQ